MALFKAAIQGDAKQVALELQSGAVKVDAIPEAVESSLHTGRTALAEACAQGHEDVVSVLLDAGASLQITDAVGDAPLHLAAAAGHVGVVRLILKRDEGQKLIELSGWGGRRPLHAAAFGGHPKVVRELLRAGALPNPKDDAGETPSDNACGFVGADDDVCDRIVRMLRDSVIDIENAKEEEVEETREDDSEVVPEGEKFEYYRGDDE